MGNWMQYFEGGTTDNKYSEAILSNLVLQHLRSVMLTEITRDMAAV